jgi:hypothetical protein
VIQLRNLPILTMLALLLIGFANPAAAQGEQEPAPENPPVVVPPLSPDQIMQEVADAIEVVRKSFADTDRLLLESRTLAEDADQDVSEKLGQKLNATAVQAEQLMADLEELLSLLPDSDQESESSGGSSSSSDSNSPKPGGDPKDQKEGDGNQPSNQAAPEGDRGDSQVPFMTELLLAPGSGGGAWGYLPPRLQETLQNAHAEDLPLRYRGLLEKFHQRNMDPSKRR